MVHRMVKAALEYVSQIPSDINNVIDKIDQELNRMADPDSVEEHYVKKPLYPLDSRTIYQMLNKKKTPESKINLILKYEMPSVQEPQCKEALEKLIEIAYNAYLELGKHPQCRDYLYKLASHQPEDRPKGHLEYEPDLKSLIASILEQIDKYKPKSPLEDRNSEYSDPEVDIPIPVVPIPQTHEMIPKNHDSYEINYPKIHEINLPPGNGIFEINIPNIHKTYDTKLPKTHDNYGMNYPEVLEDLEKNGVNIPNLLEAMNRPKVHKNYGTYVPNVHDKSQMNTPKDQETNIPQVHEIPEYNIPHIQDMSIPQVHEIPQTHESIPENMPLRPEETVNILTKLLKNHDHPGNGNLFDRLKNIVQENPNHFHPRVFEILLNLLNAHKIKNIPRFNDIFLLLLDSQRHKPWSEKTTEHILSYLKPDQTGNVDSRIVDIILNLYKNPNEKHIEYVLSLLKSIKDGDFDSRYGDIILNLVKSHQNNLLQPKYIDILLKLLKPSRNGPVDTKEFDIVNHLSRWNELGLSPNHLDTLFTLLKPDNNGNIDKRAIDIIYLLFVQNKYLSPKDLEFILSFLYPENGILDTRRIDIIHFILNNAVLHPKPVNILINLLQENAPGVLNSRFLEILLLLNSNKLLSPELLETVIDLLKDELTGNLDENQLKKFFFQLAPLKQSNPKVVVDILTLLNQGGLHGNIDDWLDTTDDNAGIPNRDASSPSFNVLIEKLDNLKGKLDHPDQEYKTPDRGYETENDVMSIFKWLDSQGILNPSDQGAPNSDVVNKLLKVLDMGDRELGVVELTYMLKHERPLIYQPVYYVKYRLPILSFISNMKSLLVENPQLTADPMKLLQEMIVVSNVTEVSPNLQGYPKEEIMKLTVNDGDLVQAKILDEQNLSLNEQISYVHGLNTDITPEEILELNRINEAQYYPSLLQIKESPPEKMSVRKVDQIVQYPAFHYELERPQTVPHQRHTIQKVYERTYHYKQPHKNSQFRSSK